MPKRKTAHIGGRYGPELSINIVNHFDAVLTSPKARPNSTTSTRNWRFANSIGPLAPVRPNDRASHYHSDDGLREHAFSSMTPFGELAAAHRNTDSDAIKSNIATKKTAARRAQLASPGNNEITMSSRLVFADPRVDEPPLQRPRKSRR